MATRTVSCLVVLMAVVVGGASANIDLSNINVNDIQQQLPAEFARANMSLDDAKKMVKDKCIQVAGEEAGTKAFNEIESATVALGECINRIVNYTAMQAEIEEASPKGELDAVFNKYCLKRPEALECVETFNSKLAPCFDKEEREHQDVFMRIVRSLLNFVCHKGGDQIALFIAEKGPECLESRKDDIQQCINNTFSSYIPAEGLESVTSLPKFVMGPQQCDEIEELEKCIVKKLETCEEITPANIVESMFRFIKNETICHNVSQARKQTSSGSATLMLSIQVACTFVFVLTAFDALSKRVLLA